MDRITLLSAFVMVAEKGSFSKAAMHLRVTQSQVSKMVKRLEEELNCTLFIRTTRALTLTDEGERLVLHAKTISDSYTHALEDIGGSEAELRGTIRVLTSDCTGRTLFIQSATKFLEQHPRVHIDHVVRDICVNLVEQQIDIAVSIGPLPDSSYRTKRVGLMRCITVAAPSYLKKHGTPKTPQDLQLHDCITFSKLGAYLGNDNQSIWSYLDSKGKALPIEVTGRYNVDNSSLAWEAALLGLGIYQGPNHLLADDIQAGRLVEILPHYKLESFPIHLIYPAQGYMPQRLRAFIDFFTQELSLNPWIAE